MPMKKYPCDNCDYEAFDQSTLKQHKRVVHKKEKNYPCNLCDKKFSYATALKNHAKVVHNPDVKDEKCDQCDFETQTKDKLRRHKNTHHTKKNKEINFKCEPCEKSFTSYAGHRAHMLSAHSDIRHKCDICDSVFTQKTSLTHHNKVYHIENKMNKCNLCEKEFRTSTHLRRHNLEIHMPVKKWHNCDKCDYKAKTPRSLEIHQVSHMTTTAFNCELCPKAFKTNKNLNHHTRRVHLKDLKKTKCEQCDYSTTSNTTLRVHVDAVHLGLRPYKCDVCGSSFTQLTHLRTHKNRIHIEKNV